jgi:hypothetical protein
MFVELNLPSLPTDFKQNLLTYLQQKPLNSDNKRWLDQFHNNTINSAEHVFYIADDAWGQRVAEIYQPYFNGHTVLAGFGIMKNTNTTPACLPPHTDRARGLAINCYLEPGGPAVTTVFYNQTVPTQNNQASNFLYASAGQPVGKVVFGTSWYAYDVNAVHSVENIIGQRYILILLLESSQPYQLHDFISDYPELIKVSNA